MASPSIAIIGSGPSGCYMAQSLRRSWPDSEIVVLDRLPVPYGLVRYGVAPDHPGTKAVVRQFERLFERENIRFIGNVEVGSELPLEAVRKCFDIVVIATGLHGDRRLGLSGDDVANVYGAGRVTRMLNDHPDECGFSPVFGKRPVIIGNGNVAIDVLRLLVKSTNDFDGSDISDESLAHLGTHQVEELHIVGRSAASSAKFDTVMIKELGKLDHVIFEIGADSDLGEAVTAAEQAKVQAILELAERRSSLSSNRKVIFHFGWAPAEIDLTAKAVSSVRFARKNSEETKCLPATSILTAVGFQEEETSSLQRRTLICDGSDIGSGLLDKGLFCTGWYRRGPTGTIPENRTDAKLVAERIVSTWCAGGEVKPGLGGLAAKLQDFVDYQGWLKIDQLERSGASDGRIRRKIRDIESMLKAALKSGSGV